MSNLRGWRPSPAIVVSAVALVGAFGGAALATSAPGGSVIHGCAKKSTGALRVVKAGKKCRRGERALSWNRQGQPGPRGVTGGTGPQGPGAVEYTYSLLNTGEKKTLGPAGPFQLSASCTTSGGENVNQLLETNTTDVGFDSTTISSSGVPPTSIVSGSVSPTASPAPLEVTAGTPFASRHAEYTITSPTGQLGQLTVTVQTLSNSCEGSVVWVPASG